MLNLAEIISDYVSETRKLESLPSSTETSFYPDLKTLLNAVLKSERLPFDTITGTSENGARQRDMPDFVLGDSSLFVGVYGEVKRADTSLSNLAISTEQKDQIGRYLSQTGVVLLCNVRGIGLLTCDPLFQREPGKPVPPDKRVLEKAVDLWSAVGSKQKVGRPCIRGLRIAVADVLDWLAAGMSHKQILADYPELTEDDIRACLPMPPPARCARQLPRCAGEELGLKIA